MQTKQLFLILNGQIPEAFNFKQFYAEKFVDIHADSMWTSDLFITNLAGYKLSSLDNVLEILNKHSKSKILEAKIINMKPSKNVQLFRTSNSSYLFAYYMTNDDIDFLTTADNIKKELASVNELIQSKIPVELLNKKKLLEKQMRNFKK